MTLSARIGSWAATNCQSLAVHLVDVAVDLAKNFANTNMGKKVMDAALSKAIKTAGKDIIELADP